jgi:PPOX class probable F420-dependent enzyme
MTEQRRGRRIALTPEECDRYLREQRTCRVGTVGPDGRPHVSALWFVWDGSALWLNSLTNSQRWANLMRSPEVSVLVDSGHEFMELAGVELVGTVAVVGDVPRTDTPDPDLETPERLFGDKYAAGRGFSYDGRHAWLRLVPEKVLSWDFSKIAIPAARG